MTRSESKILNLLALLLLLTALGVAIFWANWFLSGDFRTAGDEGYRIFENSFPLPDGIMALLLVLTAGLILMRHEWALLFGFLAAGMLLYLASLDTLYHLQHGNFSDLTHPQTWMRLFIAVYCYGLGIVMMAVLWFRRLSLLSISGATEWPPAAGRADLIGAGLLQSVYAIGTLAYWICRFVRTPVKWGDWTSEFHFAFTLGDAAVVLIATISVLAMLCGSALYLTFGLAAWGGVIFSILNYAAFALLNPSLVGGDQLAYIAFSILFLWTAGLGAGWLWRGRRFIPLT